MIKKSVFGGYDMSAATIEEIFVDEPAEDENDISSVELEEMKELEKRLFEGEPKHGKFAHAYKRDIDNLLISQLRAEGKSYREIAARFGCSPSTIRNRNKKLNGG